MHYRLGRELKALSKIFTLIGITAVHITMHCANLNKGEKSANGSENDIEQCIQK